MKLLTWSPELTLPPASSPKRGGWPPGVPGSLSTFEWDAWIEQYVGGHTFDYEDLRDAQNDAARGVMQAIYALHVFKVYLIAERLNPS